MTLPKIDVGPIHTSNLKVLNKEIHFRPYNIGHEKAILTSLQNKDLKEFIVNYSEIMRDCILTDFDYDRLTLVDFLKITILLKSKSKGEMVNLQRRKCKNTDCGKPFEFAVNLEESIVYENEENIKGIVKVTDDLSVEVSPLKLSYLSSLVNKLSEVDGDLNTVAYSISKVIFERKIYENINPKELIENVLHQLNRSQLNDIIDVINGLIEASLEIKSKCIYCGNEEVDRITDFFGLLRL